MDEQYKNICQYSFIINDFWSFGNMLVLWA